jgi:NADH:ubiquinone oxidoreductase subunit F (NADH-binding)
MSAPTLTTNTLLPDAATGPDEHGPIPWRGPGRLVGDLAAAGLTGRGGAGFPAWRKAAAVVAGESAVVVGNAAEGEPLSRKDAELLRRNPHLVLDGLQLAAEATGATEAVLYLPAGARAGVGAALALRRERDRLPVRLVTAPGTFLAGEESAVLAALAGRPARPRMRTALVVHSGLHGRPTLVHNVETLAHLAQIARFGPHWFTRAGTRDEPGTMLVTVSGAVATPGVRQVGLGTPLRQVLAAAGAGPVQAVLVGGYHGVWVPAAALGTPLSRAGLARFGGSPGAGVLHVLPVGACGARVAAGILEYLAGQSARQCGPCRNGLPQLPAALTEPDRIESLAGLVTGRGACHHPDGAARFARSTAAVFAAELAAHRHGRCAARS